jgi:hypothetical protein
MFNGEKLNGVRVSFNTYSCLWIVEDEYVNKKRAEDSHVEIVGIET